MIMMMMMMIMMMATMTTKDNDYEMYQKQHLNHKLLLYPERYDKNSPRG